MTRARTAVLTSLDSAAEPLSAGAVFARTGKACDQATVYRALGWLEESGMAESFVLRCSEHGTERYYVSAAKPHRHWFHCESCHRFIDLGACSLGELSAKLEEELGVKLRRHTLFFVGHCGKCAVGMASRQGS